MSADLPTRRLLAAGAIIAGVCLSFAAFTGHMWEDYFITFRASLNLATGHGLVFQPGERVHTFTSPLGTLLPALFALGGGDNVAVRALWLFRILSAAALATALCLAARTMLRAQLAPFAVAAGGVAWAFDPKTVDFSINGMETALLVLAIVATWRAINDGARLWPTAAAFAALQWVRPDGCVFFAVLAIGWLALGAPDEEVPSAARLWRLGRGVALGIVFYLPWIAFAWWYYGSPVPHTILAKVSHHAPGELGHALAMYPWRLMFGHVALHDVFMPAYFFFGGWPAAIEWISRIVVVVAAVAWLFRGVRPAGRVASLAFFLGGFYVEYIPRSPWYYPGWEALALLAWAYALDAAMRATGASRPRFYHSWLAPTARAAAVVFVVVQAALLGAVAWEMRAQQSVIENGQRTEIGRWLRTHAAKGDRVYLEPLGYIGFFSGLKMLDYPGLSSPEVVTARRAGHQPHAGIISALRPEWLVLRPDQVEGIKADQPRLLAADYRLERLFDVRAQVDAIRFLPGRNYLEFDAVYLVFHRARGVVALQ